MIVKTDCETDRSFYSTNSQQCVTCGGGEELLPVSDGVPLGGAVGEAGVVDAVDDREHSHQAVVATEGEVGIIFLSQVLGSPQGQCVGQEDPVISFGRVLVEHVSVEPLLGFGGIGLGYSSDSLVN